MKLTEHQLSLIQTALITRQEHIKGLLPVLKSPVTEQYKQEIEEINADYYLKLKKCRINQRKNGPDADFGLDGGTSRRRIKENCGRKSASQRR